MTTPLISVIVPAYKVAPFIGDTLASVIGQSLRDWECIVIDDGSPDDTAAVVGRIEDPRRFGAAVRAEDDRTGNLRGLHVRGRAAECPSRPSLPASWPSVERPSAFFQEGAA